MTDKKNKFKPFSDKNWWKSGLIWGLIMFVIMVFAIKPYTDGENYDANKKLMDLVIWVIGGLGYGAIMRVYTRKQEEKGK